MNTITAEPRWVRYVLIFLGVGWFACLLLLPLATVFIQAFAKGISFYWQSLIDTDALAALRLTLFTVFCSVPLNILFGLTAAWAIGRFRFPGRQALITLIDLPFSVSPVIASVMLGVSFVLLLLINQLQAWSWQRLGGSR